MKNKSLSETLLSIASDALQIMRISQAPTQDLLQRVIYNLALENLQKNVNKLKPLKVPKKYQKK